MSWLPVAFCLGTVPIKYYPGTKKKKKKDSTKYPSAHHVMCSKKGSMCLSKLMIINDQ